MTTTTKLLLYSVSAAILVGLGRLSTHWQGADGRAVDEARHDDHRQHQEDTAPSEEGGELWTCPMHPQIKLPDPGSCPLCGMDLVPMAPGGDQDPRQLVMSPAAVALARIVSEPVRRQNVTRPVRLVGKVDYDETAVRTISAWVAGRLDRLYVDYTGVRVEAGDHLVKLYSPDLSTAQEELLAAKERLQATAGEASEFLAESNLRAYESAREKLLLWGLTEEQVAEVEQRGRAEDYVMLTSPSSGVVIDKWLDQGAYVKTGTPIYRVADLARLWVRLDAYEQDLAWLRLGQTVTLQVEALPGELFEGRISFIDPIIDERTRTAKVRVNVENERGRLKPGMFVRAVASARIGAGGVVLDRHLEGKWVSPMHPEVVKDGPGSCDICGMDLRPAEELGLVDPEPAEAERPVVVPVTAVLLTGKRAVVYVESPGRKEPTYEGREVVLGPRAGDLYVVLSGLEAGERVVVNGAFRIDSSMQVQAKPSMMDMPAQSSMLSGPEGLLFSRSLEPLFQAYLGLQQALGQDEYGSAQAAVEEFSAAVVSISAAGLPEGHRIIWKEESQRLEAGLAAARQAGDLDALRRAFEGLSEATLTILREFGNSTAGTLREAFCPMAFDGRGAFWVQAGERVLNPYFGASMQACGDLLESFDPPGAASQSPASAPAAAPDTEGSSGMEHEHGHTEGTSSSEVDPLSGDQVLEISASSREAVAQLVEAYLASGQSLVASDFSESRTKLGPLRSAVATVIAGDTYQGRGRVALDGLSRSLEQAESAGDLECLRAAFSGISAGLIELLKLVGNPSSRPLRLVHCPMALDFEGADWLQHEEEILNPYFGDEMLSCGSIQLVLEGR